MNLTDFENAVQARVKAGAGGITTIWANQTRDRPVRPFVELDILGSDTTEHAALGIADNPSSTGTDGQELILTAEEHTELMVQVRVFSSAVTGSSKAFNIAQAIRSRLATESYVEALEAVGIAVVERGNVRDATIVLESEHEGRAVLDIRFRVADLTTETATVIEEAEVETTVEQTSGNVVKTITVTAP